MTLTERRAKAATLFSDAKQAGYKTLTEAVTPSVAVTPEEGESVDLVALTALAEYYAANEMKNEGTRNAKKARKVLDTLKAGVYGPWQLLWVPNPNREEVDMAAVEALYAKLSMKVPMRTKPIADSLKVSTAEA